VIEPDQSSLEDFGVEDVRKAEKNFFDEADDSSKKIRKWWKPSE